MKILLVIYILQILICIPIWVRKVFKGSYREFGLEAIGFGLFVIPNVLLLYIQVESILRKFKTNTK